jgi:hypothetical protein
MALNASRFSAEPLMDTPDKLAAQRPVPSTIVPRQASRVARPFGAQLNYLLSIKKKIQHLSEQNNSSNFPADQIVRSRWLCW